MGEARQILVVSADHPWNVVYLSKKKFLIEAGVYTPLALNAPATSSCRSTDGSCRWPS